MSIELIANFFYIISAALFIFGLKLLGSPATARRGNLLSSLGMLIAVVAGLSAEGIIDYKFIIIGMILGSVIGATAARLVAMTSMPEMVALFNGSGGAASLLVGWGTLYGSDVSTFTAFTVILAILIGGLTFTGSLIAYGKLSEAIGGGAVVFKGQRVFNTLLLAGLIGSAVMLALDPSMEQVPKKLYIAYRISQNIVCMEIQKQRVLLYLKLDPKSVDAPANLSRDVSNIGHYGTGDFELSIKTLDDFEATKNLLELAYQKVGG